MKLKCSSCGNEWSYEGKNKIHARCPDCLAYVKIKACRV